MLERDRKLVRDASAFLSGSVIPRFVHDCIQLSVTPMDGEALCAAMHARGINMRYLGQVATLATLRDDLHHIKVGGRCEGVGLVCMVICWCVSPPLQCLCFSEMVLRLAKRRLRKLLQESKSVANLLLLFFTSSLLSPSLPFSPLLSPSLPFSPLLSPLPCSFSGAYF